MLDKKDYIERVALRVKEWDARIDELKAKAEFAGIQDKAVFRQELTDLKEKRDKGTVVLRELHEACEDEWAEVRRNAEDLLEETGTGFRAAA